MFVLVVILSVMLRSCKGELKTYKYTQKLDHFGHNQSLTFQQKIVVNDNRWAGSKSKAPIFVLLGGLKNDPYSIDDFGILKLCAQQFKALLIYIEHRFYGDSIPLGSTELAMANHRVRKFLTTEQALEDYATIIHSFKVNLSAHDSPVIVAGLCYGGALATWFRLRYPNIAIGALASSTPLSYYGNHTLRDGYCLTEVNQECYQCIRNAWKGIENIASFPNGLAILSRILNTCRPLQSLEELKQWAGQLFSHAALSDDSSHTEINIICQRILSSKGAVEGLALALKTLSYPSKCYDNVIFAVDSPFEPTSNFTTTWAWLRCNELIYPVGCVRDTMLPSHPFDMTKFTQSCQNRFGEFPHLHSPTVYGNYNMEEALIRSEGNILFSYSSKDPSSSAGILKNLSDTIIAITTDKGPECWDMYPIKEDDPKWLKDKREDELEIIRHWINLSHHSYNESNHPSCSLFTYFLLEILVVLYMLLN